MLLLLVPLLSSPVSAQQGCCSWHGGISHCDSSVGRYVCSDGTYSPSCGCYRAQQSFTQARSCNYYLYNDICYDFEAKKFWVNENFYKLNDPTPQNKLKEILCSPAPTPSCPAIVKAEESFNLTPYLLISGLSFTFGLWLRGRYSDKQPS